MAKFKIGDRVRSVTETDWTGIVVRVADNSYDILTDDGDIYVRLRCDCFDFIHSFTKNDLENGDIVTLRNGNELIYIYDCFYDVSRFHDNMLNHIDDIRDDMTYDDSDYRESDIMKVSRPVNCANVFSRSKESKKMTVSEICKELGYDVEIVKEGE